MHRPGLLCKNAVVSRHSAMMRTLAALLASLLALAPSAHAAARKAPVAVLPYAVFPAAPDGVGARIGELLSQELRRRAELKLAELKAQPARAKGGVLAQARAALGKAAELAQKSRHAEAADALEKAISLLTANPSALDERAGKLLSDAALQLAVERLIAGDEDSGDAALAQLVRLSPEREVNPADYPPAFIVELSGVRKRLLASPRGSLRVLAAPGEGETRVLLDGRPLRSAPLLVKDLIPGEHFVRLERGGVAWGQKIIVIAGVETPVAPQPGIDAPAAGLTGAPLSLVTPTPVPSPSAAPEPVRRVAIPGAPVAALEPTPKAAVVTSLPPAPVRPTEEAPSRALVIPRQRTPDEPDPAALTAKLALPPAQQRLQALEPDAIKTVREAPPKQSHTALWILAGVVVAGVAGLGGYFLWQSMQTPTTANVNATWSH